MAGIITIVGKPNVGKSALFNRIAGRRIAIVHDMPGVTRDRVMAELEWNGQPFSLMDTGGIALLKGEKTGDIITQSAVMQVDIAISESDLILFVVDLQTGLTALDYDVADRLRRSQKKIFLVCNKADSPDKESHTVEFEKLGFKDVFSVSAIHGRGIDILMNSALQILPKEKVSEIQEVPAEISDDIEDEETIVEKTNRPLKIAFVGRPNVGKSSTINKLTHSNRVIVSPIPGTTRDSIEVPFSVETDGVKTDYILVDTAGIRKERRVTENVEFYSIKRTEDAIERCDIAVLLLDASEGILEQDKKIADKIVEAHKACIIAVNKWDLMAENVKRLREEAQQKQKERGSKKNSGGENELTLENFAKWVQEKLFFLSYAPVIFTSAEDGFNLNRLLEAVRYVADQLKQEIPTGLLNRLLASAVEERQPVSTQGTFLKFYYATQVKQTPPTFLIFVNKKELIKENYEKFLADRMRQNFGYEGCPILFITRARPKKVESKRTHRKASGKTRSTEKYYSVRGRAKVQSEGKLRRRSVAKRDARSRAKQSE